MKQYVAVLALVGAVLSIENGLATTGHLALPKVADIVVHGYGQLQPAGDVNGDGVGDLVFREDCAPGSVHVPFGPFGEFVSPFEHPGFSINGAGAAGNQCHLPLSPAGDVNGDGLDDVLVGSRSEDPNGISNAGIVYVVFGRVSEADVLLNDFDAGTQGASGFRIDGPGGSAYVGQHFSGAGDVNADGFADIVVGLAFYGRTYVVFGKSDTENIDLADIDFTGDDPRGFVVQTQGNDRDWGYSVNGAGDVNGDGYGDVVIGAIGDVNASIGRAYVIFGKPDGQAVDATASLKGKGFRIEGLHHGDATGYAVSGAGDVNADGLDDVIIGTPRFTLACCRGWAHVIFGKADSDRIQLRHLGDGGFRIRGANKLDDAATSLSAAGDVNSDGYADVIVGSRYEKYLGTEGAGAFNVIFGKPGTDTVRLAHLGSQGLKFVGSHKGDAIGYWVGGGHDLNGDGIPDFVISTLRAGEQYVVFAEN